MPFTTANDNPDERRRRVTDQLPVSDPLAPVRIRNVTRRSLSIRVPGQSVHLPPGQTAVLPRAYLDTSELKSLRHAGSVRLLEETTQVAVEEGAADGPGDELTGEGKKRSSRRAR